MRKFFNKVLVYVNMAIGIALLLSYLAKFIAPGWFFPIALLGLAFPYILFLFVFLTLITLVLKNYKLLFFNVLIIALGYQDISKLLQFNPKQSTTHDLRVMSYNVKLFDLYNWNKNKIQKRKILSEISRYQPDVVCFQEFYFDNKAFPIDSVTKVLQMPYYYVAESNVIMNQYHFGQAIFSKYPITNKELIKYPETTNMSMFCDVQFKNKMIRVYSNHLESYRFGSTNLGLIDDIRQLQNAEKERFNSIYKHLKKGMKKRAYQAEKIASHLKSSQYPLIVAGDFNDTPHSYAYRTISDGLNDAFVNSGMGIGKTYNNRFLHFRIDYILYNQSLKCVNYQRLNIDVSDHFPIIADFVVE